MDLGSKKVPTKKFSGCAMGLHQLEAFRRSRASDRVRYFVSRAASHPGAFWMICCRREVIGGGMDGVVDLAKDPAVVSGLFPGSRFDPGHR